MIRFLKIRRRAAAFCLLLALFGVAGAAGVAPLAHLASADAAAVPDDDRSGTAPSLPAHDEGSCAFCHATFQAPLALAGWTVPMDALVSTPHLPAPAAPIYPAPPLSRPARAPPFV